VNVDRNRLVPGGVVSRAARASGSPPPKPENRRVLECFSAFRP